MFTSSTWREIRYFHFVVVQWPQRNVQKSVLHVQKLLFCWSKPFAFLPFSLTSPSSLLTQFTFQATYSPPCRRHGILGQGRLTLYRIASRVGSKRYPVEWEHSPKLSDETNNPHRIRPIHCCNSQRFLKFPDFSLNFSLTNLIKNFTH